MSARSPTGSGKSEFSGKITRQLVSKAEDLFGSTLDDEKINSVLSEVLQGSEDLADSERAQLAEIARLMQQGQEGGKAPDGFAYGGDFELTPAPDKMVLSLTVRAPVAGGEAVKVNDVLRCLKDQNVTLGVDMNALRRAVEQAAKGQEVRDVVVVRGRAPRPGQDARIERFARRTNDAPLLSVGTLPRDAAEILLCKQGDVVMRYVPPVAGEAGHTALGEAITPPAPQDVEVAAGRNIRHDGNAFVAEVTGVVVFEGNQVEARKALILSQDVTRQSEPVDFDGEVLVRAAVRSGASIKATGNVVVEGPVEAAEIESTEGDVVLRSGVAGQQAAVIRAARDVISRFAESASVVAGRDITLQVGSLHSRLIAYHRVQATQGKGHLAGGVIMAGERVSVKQLGAKGGVRTDVTVGLDREVLDTMSQIDQLAARARQRRDTCTELVNQIERAIGDPLKLSQKELAVYTRLRQLQLVCDVQIRKLNHRRRELLADCVRHTGGRVEIHSGIMPNVGVVIGSAEFEPEARSGACTLVFDEAAGKIVVRRGV